jgi:prolyl-tRNA synthetase
VAWSFADLGASVTRALEEAQREMLEQARAFLEDNLLDASSVDEAADAARTGFARLPIALLRDGGEQRLAGEGVTVRCLITPDGGLPTGHDDPESVAVVGRAY